MQPQDAGTGFDWLHGLSGLGGGALGTFLTWLWRAARVEPQMKLEIEHAKEDVEAKIESAERRSKEEVHNEMSHLRESFDGIRRQIDDHKLHTVENFVRRDDFNRMRQEDRKAAEERREENRAAFDRLERKIDQILGQRSPPHHP